MSASNFLHLPLHNAIRETQIVSAPPRNEYVVIGTHDGSFHCDEALAVAMLKCLPEYHSAVVLRTRDPALLAEVLELLFL